MKLKEEIVELGAKTFVGIAVDTDFDTELNPETGKIGGHWDKFIQEDIYGKIPNKKTENVYGLYTDVYPNEYGSYTLTLGAEVEGHVNEAPEGMVIKRLPAQKYIKFTTEHGPIPEVIIDGWKYIWEYFKDSDYQRTYGGEFEFYDERSYDMNNAQLDIYISIL